MTAQGPAIPLSRWAGRHLAELTRISGATAIARLSGADLLGERASLNHFRVPHRQSAGGGCRLLAARDGWIALNLSRPDDRAMLPALFEVQDAELDLEADVARRCAAPLVARGREMGMAIAATGETPPTAIAAMQRGPQRPVAAPRRPLVVDLSALWAGPLAGHLLWLAGAHVVKVESRTRPDMMRRGDPALFARLNQGKASVSVDLASHEDRGALLALLERADIVIEASRPRALRQLGIDADALVARRPGLVWLTITGHGASGAAADWVGFGDDCAVAGGLTAALAHRSGVSGFVGDAIGDPLTGITAALAAWKQWHGGHACRIGLAMAGVVAQAIADETAHDSAAFGLELVGWAGGTGQPFPAAALRPVTAEVRAPGADTAEWLGRLSPC